jgi:iron complex transport system substrate-binding protein
MGIPVLALQPNSLAGVLEAISLVGQASGHGREASDLVQALERRLKSVREQAKGAKKRDLKVLVMLGQEPVWTAGPGTFLDEAVNLAGGQNIAADAQKSWVQLSTELIIKRNPDVIITGMDPQKVYQNRTWRTLAAVEKKQVYQIDEDAFSRPGPRLFSALENLSALLVNSR